MAAAALLRSIARKLARAAPPPPRPLLAGGLHGGIRSGPGGSLPPLAGNQIRQVSGDRFGVGMAATGGLRSLATKIARVPPHPHHRRILNRGLHSGSTPTTDKDKLIEELRRSVFYGQATAAIGTVVLLGMMIYGQFWVLPKLKKQVEKSVAFDRLLDELKDIIRANEDDRRSAALAQIIQTAGHMKQQRNGTTEKGKVDKLEEEVMAVCFDILKEVAADLKELRTATAPMSKLSPLEQNEGCSRVGSETVGP